jgi:hypothetical protein
LWSGKSGGEEQLNGKQGGNWGYEMMREKGEDEDDESPSSQTFIDVLTFFTLE